MYLWDNNNITHPKRRVWIMFDLLSGKLTGLGSLFGEKKKLDDESVQAACQVLRRALLEADVSYRVARQFVKRVRERAISSETLDGFDAEDQFMGLMHQELSNLLGDAQTVLNAVNEESTFTPEKPAIILFCGLQGSGKTTTSSKLALWLSKQDESIKPFLIAADTVRPAAMEQLAILADRVGVPHYKDLSATKMDTAVKAGIVEAKAKGATHIIVDTAGRLQADTETMAELFLLKQTYKPVDTLLVVDAMIGQEAVNVVEAFNTQIELTGCVLSKMDGDAKGGAMLSVREATGLPIQFIGTGETPDDLEPFHPDRMAQRLMGMGDLATLFEKAMSQQQESSMASISAKLMQGQLNFQDYVGLQESISKLGGIGSILSMLPMMKLDSDTKSKMGQSQVERLRQWRALLCSMKLAEKQNPELVLNSESRQRRLFQGAGITTEAGAGMLSEFGGMYQMARGMKGMMSFFNGDTTDDEPETPIAPEHDIFKMLGMDSEETDSNELETSENPDDPMGWGSFFEAMGMDMNDLAEDETTPASPPKKQKKAPSAFPW